MMTRDEVRPRVSELLSDITDNPVQLTDTTTADEVPDWDSINHVKLIIAIEREFKIRFAADEVTAPDNVGALLDTIIKKAGGKT